MREILQQARRGQLKMSFRLIGMESVRRTIDRVGYRLIYGLVLAALLVSSSLIIQADIPPRFREIPIIGLAGFAVAGVLGVGFLISLMVHFFRK
jgi:ubiquinone biosynthesis protein